MPPLGGKLAGDRGFERGFGVIAAEPFAVLAGARNGSVQCKADSIQHAGFARPGGSIQEEQAVGAESVKVDLFGAGKRSERGDGQAVNPHSDAARRRTLSRAAVSANCSASSASRPRT